ncbi:hypothetical protein AJ78_08692, partial [Emergomyces pasteurianus Ep9510]
HELEDYLQLLNNITAPFEDLNEALYCDDNIQAVLNNMTLIVNTLGDGVRHLDKEPPLPLNDAIQLGFSFRLLDNLLEDAIGLFIQVKDWLLGSGIGDQVRSFLATLSAGFTALSFIITEKVAVELKDFMRALSLSLVTIVQRGIDAYRLIPTFSSTTSSSAASTSSTRSATTSTAPTTSRAISSTTSATISSTTSTKQSAPRLARPSVQLHLLVLLAVLPAVLLHRPLPMLA